MPYAPSCDRVTAACDPGDAVCLCCRFRASSKKHSSASGGGESSYALTVRCPPEPPLISMPDERPLTPENTWRWAWTHSFRRFHVAK